MFESFGDPIKVIDRAVWRLNGENTIFPDVKNMIEYFENKKIGILALKTLKQICLEIEIHVSFN